MMTFGLMFVLSRMPFKTTATKSSAVVSFNPPLWAFFYNSDYLYVLI